MQTAQNDAADLSSMVLRIHYFSTKLKKGQKWDTYHIFGGLEGSSWSQVEVMLGQVGPNLRPCWDKLGKCAAKLGPSCPNLG